MTPSDALFHELLEEVARRLPRTGRSVEQLRAFLLRNVIDDWGEYCRECGQRFVVRTSWPVGDYRKQRLICRCIGSRVRIVPASWLRRPRRPSPAEQNRTREQRADE